MPRPTVRPDALLVQAVIAGALSFAHLHDIAAAAGQDGWKAWAYPISVDLLLVAAWRQLRILRTAHRPAGAAWTWFLVALAASLGANVATAGLLDLADVPAWLRILVAGWPALAFLGGTLLVHTPNPAPAADPAPVQGDEDPTPVEITRPMPEETPPAEAAPALPPATAPDPAPVPADIPAPVIPDALLTYARKVADEHQTRTGTPIAPDTLRARLGVPAPMADAIAAQLA
ncbi:DUF2637 domain-containing protein [Streptomyces sp. NPDC004111]|uniref:DUF2637 domain-containing protein n=1 Tax=Streptomyces sp. NPDC004111 TaxID=3364690 RepID=UPI003678AA48